MDIAKILTDINTTVAAVKDGTSDPIRAYRNCKTIADTIKAAMDEMYNTVLDECDK